MAAHGVGTMVSRWRKTRDNTNTLQPQVLPPTMPPPPDTLYDETRTKLERIERRLNEAESFQIPRLRDHVGTLALQQQYAAELREDLESCRRELQVGVFLYSSRFVDHFMFYSPDTGDIC